MVLEGLGEKMCATGGLGNWGGKQGWLRVLGGFGDKRGLQGDQEQVGFVGGDCGVIGVYKGLVQSGNVWKDQEGWRHSWEGLEGRGGSLFHPLGLGAIFSFSIPHIPDKLPHRKCVQNFEWAFKGGSTLLYLGWL